jgi:molybdopterin-binding protein
VREQNGISPAVADRGVRLAGVTLLKVADAARLLGVSDDTVRRWIDAGKIASTTDPGGRAAIDGAELARFARSVADDTAPGAVLLASARNRFTGIVTAVLRDTVMAQVELQCGPHRVVSLMSREAADQLQLEPGVVAVASIKSTNVVVELPA